MQRPSGTDEDGRDGKQLPHAEREGAAGADHNSTLRQSCFLDCVCVCVSVRSHLKDPVSMSHLSTKCSLKASFKFNF